MIVLVWDSHCEISVCVHGSFAIDWNRNQMLKWDEKLYTHDCNLILNQVGKRTKTAHWLSLCTLSNTKQLSMHRKLNLEIFRLFEFYYSQLWIEIIFFIWKMIFHVRILNLKHNESSEDPKKSWNLKKYHSFISCWLFDKYSFLIFLNCFSFLKKSHFAVIEKADSEKE